MSLSASISLNKLFSWNTQGAAAQVSRVMNGGQALIAFEWVVQTAFDEESVHLLSILSNVGIKILVPLPHRRLPIAR